MCVCVCVCVHLTSRRVCASLKLPDTCRHLPKKNFVTLPTHAMVGVRPKHTHMHTHAHTQTHFPLDNENAMPDKYFTAVRVGSLVDIMKCRASA